MDREVTIPTIENGRKYTNQIVLHSNLSPPHILNNYFAFFILLPSKLFHVTPITNFSSKKYFLPIFVPQHLLVHVTLPILPKVPILLSCIE
jgi:hypothetical protein